MLHEAVLVSDLFPLHNYEQHVIAKPSNVGGGCSYNTVINDVIAIALFEGNHAQSRISVMCKNGQ